MCNCACQGPAATTLLVSYCTSNNNNKMRWNLNFKWQLHCSVKGRTYYDWRVVFPYFKRQENAAVHWLSVDQVSTINLEEGNLIDLVFSKLLEILIRVLGPDHTLEEVEGLRDEQWRRFQAHARGDGFPVKDNEHSSTIHSLSLDWGTLKVGFVFTNP